MKVMQVILNNKTLQVDVDTSLAALLEEHGLGGKHIAVAINQSIVRRELWEMTKLNPNDNILIIGAIKGG